MSRLELSLDAQHDLVEIAAHITSQSGSQKRGEAFLSGVFATCETLASQPAMGELRTEFVTGVYRSFSVGSYVIYFLPTPAGIVVARVLHGSRDHYSIL